MARYFRCCWYDPRTRRRDQPGHPLYVYPRQGAGRVDDPEHEYLVLYVAADPAGCVAEVFGDFAIWTPDLLAPPPHLPTATRAVVTYELDARICDLDDPRTLARFRLKPSDVVSHDRRRTQAWARRVFETGTHDGVSWWSRRDPRWTSVGLWSYAAAKVVDVTPLTDLDHPAVVDAAIALRRLVH